jgi:sialic acid synthase SpsE
MVQNIRNTEKALAGFEKYLLEREIPFRRKLGKSLTVRCKLKKGAILRRDMLTCKSPAEGISPILIDRLIGKRLLSDVDEDTLIKREDVELNLD